MLAFTQDPSGSAESGGLLNQERGSLAATIAEGGQNCIVPHIYIHTQYAYARAASVFLTRIFAASTLTIAALQERERVGKTGCVCGMFGCREVPSGCRPDRGCHLQGCGGCV
jgi:hypothetical protein